MIRLSYNFLFYGDIIIIWLYIHSFTVKGGVKGNRRCPFEEVG